MDYKSVVYNAARDGNLNRLKVRNKEDDPASPGKRTMDEVPLLIKAQIIFITFGLSGDSYGSGGCTPGLAGRPVKIASI